MPLQADAGDLTVTLVADIDGTLAFGGEPAGRAVVEALRELTADPRVRLVLATARAPARSRPW